jgi:hypothetical protein
MAAIAATARLHVTGLRNAPKLKGFADVLGDGLLDLLHFLLRIQETARNRVFQERLAMLFKIIYFRIGQLQPRVAFLMKHVPFGDQRVVLPAGGVIRQKGFYFLAQGLHFGPVKNGPAKFLCLLDHNCVFGLSLHNMFSRQGDFTALPVNTPQLGQKGK